MTFRLAPKYEIQEDNLDRGHKEYRVTCTLKNMASGSFVGQGVGCCSTMESKYRYRGGARKCPECGKEAIIKGKAQFGGGWLCWNKKGGCGFKWPDGAEAIESQKEEKIENENPADCYNTVLKMAKKRAFVDATITATAASDIFTQDVGDDESHGTTEPEYIPPEQPPVDQPMPEVADAATRMRALNHLEAAPGQPNRLAFQAFLHYRQWIPIGGSPEQWALEHVPVLKGGLRKLAAECQQWDKDRHQPAEA